MTKDENFFDRCLAISYIVDEMLMNPNVEASWVVQMGKYAEDDSWLYYYFCEWMKSTSNAERSRWQQKISSRYYFYYSRRKELE